MTFCVKRCLDLDSGELSGIGQVHVLNPSLYLHDFSHYICKIDGFVKLCGIDFYEQKVFVCINVFSISMSSCFCIKILHQQILEVSNFRYINRPVDPILEHLWRSVRGGGRLCFSWLLLRFLDSLFEVYRGSWQPGRSGSLGVGKTPVQT